MSVGAVDSNGPCRASQQNADVEIVALVGVLSTVPWDK
jgi:hypothetical protein